MDCERAPGDARRGAQRERPYHPSVPEEAEKITSEEEVLKRAEKRSAEIMEDARRREREIRLGAEDYADEVLANLEDNLARLLEAVQRGRNKLQGVQEEE